MRGFRESRNGHGFILRLTNVKETGDDGLWDNLGIAGYLFWSF